MNYHKKIKGVLSVNDISIYERELRLKNVLRFTLPTIIMIVFVNMYGIIDGIVVSNFIGSNCLLYTSRCV